jgi:hypothetical protein
MKWNPMTKVYFGVLTAVLLFSLWATWTGFGIPVSELEGMSLRDESTSQENFRSGRRFRGGGFRSGK